MTTYTLRGDLAGTWLEGFLSIVPTGAQLPAWVAVCAGLKPAMDLWVGADHYSALTRVAREAGLLFRTINCVDRTRAELGAVRNDAFTTTRSMLVPRLEGAAEAHVVVARSEDALDAAVASAWYPVLADEAMVDKHLADHLTFGEALGYPECCRRFFRRHDNWHRDNTLFAAYANTIDVASFLSNSLARHTAYGLVSHLACSFACSETMQQSRALLGAISADAPTYAESVRTFLRGPMLVLSELRLFRFDAETRSDGRLLYSSVEAVSPTKPDDPLLKKFRSGDSLRLDGAVIRIFHAARQTDAVIARADRHGPEVPFVIRCE